MNTVKNSQMINITLQSIVTKIVRMKINRKENQPT